MLLVAGITNTFPVFLPALLAEFGGSREGVGAHRKEGSSAKVSTACRMASRDQVT